MRRTRLGLSCFGVFIVLCALISLPVLAAGPSQGSGVPQKRIVPGFEIQTNSLKQIIVEGKIPVIDVRPEKEFAVSHIPASISIFETNIDRMPNYVQAKAALSSTATVHIAAKRSGSLKASQKGVYECQEIPGGVACVARSWQHGGNGPLRC